MCSLKTLNYLPFGWTVPQTSAVHGHLQACSSAQFQQRNISSTAGMAYLDSGCHCSSERRQNSILYSILKNDSQSAQLGNQPRAPRLAVSMRACACGSKRKVSLRSPQTTCKAASAVLVKTLKFVKNVPCFRELPSDDQHTLVRSGWAPLLVLGMAQDRIDFETSETQEPSMLQRILTSGQDKQDNQSHHGGVALTDVQGIKMFLRKCWGLDISTKEYAYLKGAILFNPGETRCYTPAGVYLSQDTSV